MPRNVAAKSAKSNEIILARQRRRKKNIKKKTEKKNALNNVQSSSDTIQNFHRASLLQGPNEIKPRLPVPVKRWQKKKRRDTSKKKKKKRRKEEEEKKKKREAEQAVAATSNLPSSYSRMPNAIELLDDVGTSDSFSCLVNSDRESEESSSSDQDFAISISPSSGAPNVWPPMVRKRTPATVQDAASDNSDPDDEHFSALLHRKEGGQHKLSRKKKQMLHDFSDNSESHDDGGSHFGGVESFSKTKTSEYREQRSCTSALPDPVALEVVPQHEDVCASVLSSTHGQSQYVAEASDIRRRRRGNIAADSLKDHVVNFTSTVGNHGIVGTPEGQSQCVAETSDIKQRRRDNVAATLDVHMVTSNSIIDDHGIVGIHGIEAIFGHVCEKVEDQNSLFSSEVNDSRIKILLEALKKTEDARHRIDNELARAKRRVASLRAKLTESLNS